MGIYLDLVSSLSAALLQSSGGMRKQYLIPSSLQKYLMRRSFTCSFLFDWPTHEKSSDTEYGEISGKVRTIRTICC